MLSLWESKTNNVSLEPERVPVNAMLPADEDVDPPQAHQHGVPVVVVAQERGDEEGQEDGHRAGEEQPRETHLARHSGRHKLVTAELTCFGLTHHNPLTSR